MASNRLLTTLGFDPAERVVCIHVDDVGMSEASVSAFADLANSGLVSSASVMVPCPWFPQVVELARAHPGLDLGVHLTLTSEWRNCRWRPLSTSDPASGLVDEMGYFPATRQQLYARAIPTAVEGEIAAQLERALTAGIDVTHLDSHMYTLFEPRLLPLYVELALAHGLPPILPCGNELPHSWFEVEPQPVGRSLVGDLRRRGVPLIDHQVLVVLRGEDPVDEAKRFFDALEPGLTHLIIHPAKDTPELRAMARGWESRVKEYETFMNPALARHIEKAGIRVIGYRPLREALR